MTQPPDGDIRFGVLDGASDDELINEIFNRFDHVQFSGMKVSCGGRDCSLTMRRWKGNHATISGLASQVITAVNMDHFNSMNPRPREEDNEQ